MCFKIPSKLNFLKVLISFTLLQVKDLVIIPFRFTNWVNRLLINVCCDLLIQVVRYVHLFNLVKVQRQEDVAKKHLEVAILDFDLS